jgi:hypothetical protein
MIFFKMSKMSNDNAEHLKRQKKKHGVDIHPSVLSVVLVNAATGAISTAELIHGLSIPLAQQHIKQHIASVDFNSEGGQGQELFAGCFKVHVSGLRV